MMLEIIKNIIAKNTNASVNFRRNLIKEYLQVLALSFIYLNKEYKSLIFYGGSSLKHCFDLPRLSEDLDFIDVKKDIDLEKLSKDLIKYFESAFDIEIKAKIQKFRIVLKFPILHDLELTSRSQSNFLHLKIEVCKEFDYCKDFKIEIVPIFKYNQSVLIRTLDLPTLMATKINAVLNRKWKKVDKTGKVLITVKGRDYFDLMWYLQKGILPNLKCLPDASNYSDLKNMLINSIEKINPQSIYLDLESLIKDKAFLKDLSKNLKKILIGLVKVKL